MSTPCGFLLLQVVGGDVVLDEITTVCSGVAVATGCYWSSRRQIPWLLAMRWPVAIFSQGVQRFQCMLLMEAIKNCEGSSSERRSASTLWLLQSPVTESTGSLRGLECIFFLFQGCLCKF
ncbi:hypothetical protein BS78_01G394700 [Paspalum vaginatum]|nr:hypothetical protein BS78_01G394700 [Paspalum vaginatum]